MQRCSSSSHYFCFLHFPEPYHESSRFLTPPQTCESPDAHLPSLLGALGCLASVFKHGKRADLLPLAPDVLRRLLASGRLEHGNTQIRKLALKSVQRVGAWVGCGQWVLGVSGVRSVGAGCGWGAVSGCWLWVGCGQWVLGVSGVR